MTTESAVLPAPVGSARGRSSVLFAIGITLAAILTGIATFFAVSGAGPIAPASKTMLWLVGLSFVLATGLTVMLALRIVRLARSRAAPETGARLHLRFASLFSLAAAAPAIVVAMFLGLALSAGVEQWFSPRVKSVVESGAGVGAAYLNQAVENVRGEILAMGEDLNNAKSGLTSDVPAYNRYLARQASLRSFPAAYVVNREAFALPPSRRKARHHTTRPKPARCAPPITGKSRSTCAIRISFARSIVSLLMTTHISTSRARSTRGSSSGCCNSINR
ncbi:MAG: hypothetical protein WDN76_12015 [Alphaproteobacteria bacterium]